MLEQDLSNASIKQNFDMYLWASIRQEYIEQLMGYSNSSS